MTVFVFLISSPTCKQITSPARRRLFRFSLFIYLYDLIYLTFIYIVWHDFILNTGAKI